MSTIWTVRLPLKKKETEIFSIFFLLFLFCLMFYVFCSKFSTIKVVFLANVHHFSRHLGFNTNFELGNVVLYFSRI
jgi:hypothetical protein